MRIPKLSNTIGTIVLGASMLAISPEESKGATIPVDDPLREKYRIANERIGEIAKEKAKLELETAEILHGLALTDSVYTIQEQSTIKGLYGNAIIIQNAHDFDPTVFSKQHTEHYNAINKGHEEFTAYIHSTNPEVEVKKGKGAPYLFAAGSMVVAGVICWSNIIRLMSEGRTSNYITKRKTKLRDNKT